MLTKTAAEHALNISQGLYTSQALCQAYYDQIDKLNPQLNAFVVDNRKAAMERAKALDSQRQSLDKLPPLFGVPVSIKESFKMKGTPTTINHPPLKDYVANEDSVFVTRLEDAGAIILGKTNIPTMLADAQTFGPLYPTCNNPYDQSRVPGGSTGGGAAAVASGMSTFEIGSDIGGSIRTPSHYCGLFGLKPTQNNHIQDGHIPPMPNSNLGFSALASTGPLARSMSDIQLAYEVCYAPRFEYRRFLPVQTEKSNIESLQGLKIGYFDEALGLKAGKDVRDGMERFTKTLVEAGASVEQIHLDEKLVNKLVQTWARLFGFVVGQDFNWPIRQIMKFMFNKDVRHSRLDVKEALGDGLSLKFKKYSRALYEQQECIAEFYRYFDQFDFIMSPTTPGPAFTHNHKHKDIELDGEKVAYSDYCFLFVLLYNVLEVPVLNVPSGLNPEGLPIGVSFSAPHFQEQRLIKFGSLLEERGFVFKAPALLDT